MNVVPESNTRVTTDTVLLTVGIPRHGAELSAPCLFIFIQNFFFFVCHNYIELNLAYLHILHHSHALVFFSFKLKVKVAEEILLY